MDKYFLLFDLPHILIAWSLAILLVALTARTIKNFIKTM